MSNRFLLTNLRLLVVYGQTCLLLHGRFQLDSDQQYHALCNYHYEEAIIVHLFAKLNVALQRQFIGQF